jgi:hypothetical protein
LLGIGSVDVPVGETERGVLGSGDRGRAARLTVTDACDLLGAVLEAPAIPTRGVAHHHGMTLGDIAGQGSSAEDLQVVGMSAYGENLQGVTLTLNPGRCYEALPVR